VSIRTVTDSEGHSLTYDYDALDRVTVVTYPDGSYEQYDCENHSLVATRDREGRWSRTFYNALMQPVLEIDPRGQTTQYEWCRCGHIRKLINGVGHLTHWVRDLQCRVTSKEFADGTSTDFSYHPFSGQLHTVTDALNQVATHNYYLDGNLAEVDYSEADTPDESFTYDPFYNRIAAMQDGLCTHAYHYHPNDGTTPGAGQVARIDGPFADDTLRYAYAERSEVPPAGGTGTVGNALNRLKTANPQPAYRLRFGYNRRGYDGVHKTGERSLAKSVRRLSD